MNATKAKLKLEISTWLNLDKSEQTPETFWPLVNTIAHSFRQGVGLGGTEISEAIAEAFAERN